jgi:hypothetical protein
LIWQGQLSRAQEQKLTLHNSAPRLDSVEYLKTTGVRNWRRKSQDRDQWREIVKRSGIITDCSADLDAAERQEHLSLSEIELRSLGNPSCSQVHALNELCIIPFAIVSNATVWRYSFVSNLCHIFEIILFRKSKTEMRVILRKLAWKPTSISSRNLSAWGVPLSNSGVKVVRSGT